MSESETIKLSSSTKATMMKLGCCINENGEPVERTKQSHPYSYDEFVLWRSGKNEDANQSVYSDRLLQWDRDKHDRLCLKHFNNKGQYWDNREPELIEAFLRDYMGKQELKLILIMEGCNVGNGYPCWRFVYSIKHAKTKSGFQ